jgi:hypothetical protein
VTNTNAGHSVSLPGADPLAGHHVDRRPFWDQVGSRSTQPGHAVILARALERVGAWRRVGRKAGWPPTSPAAPADPPGATFCYSAATGNGQAGLGAVINAVTGFSGSAAVDLSGVQEVAIRDLTIDGAAGPPGLDGILLSGTTGDVRLEDLLIQSVTGIGIASSATGGSTVHAKNVTVHQAGGSGFDCQTTDSTWTDCLALGCGAQGFFVSEGSENSKWTGCRAEWSTGNGFYVTGGWSTGRGAGGIEIANCSTDRNGQNGMTTANNCSWRAVVTRTGSTSAPTPVTLLADSA